ncbi:hypothetical protein [Vibrio parahaemolyticus]|uniref:hypothetical protein n=1 Tax=Vibrio parahaemolyticus TaxID=670 RepID=UPI0015DDBEFB|nr:hypothetical protein [Vibrio parahaemolyticus]
MKIVAVALLALLASGCETVTYVENGTGVGSQCENSVTIDEHGLRAVSMCTGEGVEQ